MIENFQRVPMRDAAIVDLPNSKDDRRRAVMLAADGNTVRLHCVPDDELTLRRTRDDVINEALHLTAVPIEAAPRTFGDDRFVLVRPFIGF